MYRNMCLFKYCFFFWTADLMCISTENLIDLQMWNHMRAMCASTDLPQAVTWRDTWIFIVTCAVTSVRGVAWPSDRRSTSLDMSSTNMRYGENLWPVSPLNSFFFSGIYVYVIMGLKMSWFCNWRCELHKTALHSHCWGGWKGQKNLGR